MTVVFSRGRTERSIHISSSLDNDENEGITVLTIIYVHITLIITDSGTFLVCSPSQNGTTPDKTAILTIFDAESTIHISGNYEVHHSKFI
jgi:hypothetical protein